MKTVEKALEIMEIIIASHVKLKLSMIAELSGINKSSVYKILQVLCRFGYLEKTKDTLYGIGPKLLDTQTWIVKRMDIGDIAQPYMEKIAKECNRTVNLMVLLGLKGVYAKIIENESSPSNESNLIGKSDFMHATAVGKAILAYLPEDKLMELIEREGLKGICLNTITDKAALMHELNLTKSRGFAIDDEESCVGARCVAAPIFNSSGEITASISVSGFPHNTSINKLFDYSVKAKEAAAAISIKL